MSNDASRCAPILVLGVGNSLLGDDGIGVHLVHRLSEWESEWNGPVEFMDGGTRGLALLEPIAGRDVLVILDAVSLGFPPGTIYVRQDKEVLDLSYRSTSAHEGNAGELLFIAALLGELPTRTFLIGIEPARLESGIELSEPVKEAIPAALEAARRVVVQALDPQTTLRDEDIPDWEPMAESDEESQEVWGGLWNAPST